VWNSPGSKTGGCVGREPRLLWDRVEEAINIDSHNSSRVCKKGKTESHETTADGWGGEEKTGVRSSVKKTKQEKSQVIRNGCSTGKLADQAWISMLHNLDVGLLEESSGISDGTK